MVLEECQIPVLVCDRDLHPGTWKDLLQRLTVLPSPPYVIVSCRQADEDLWTEALNAGAYDVLAKPFSPSELKRTLFEAAQQWRERYESAPLVMAAGV
jgi:DNA-binding response OmpR family regulator